MTSIEFDNINPIYKQIQEKAISVCNQNNIDYFNYTGSFIKDKLRHYKKSKALVTTIQNLDFSNQLTVRAVLNKNNYSSKEYELINAIKDFEKHEKEVFQWLDSTQDPYFFILNPVYEYGAGISYGEKRHGYLKNRKTGSQNIDIAVAYLNYKIVNNFLRTFA